MSNKRRRIQGSLPINTLSSTLNGRGSGPESDSGSGQQIDLTTPGQPRRYKEFRKDSRVVEEVNHSSTKNFLPLNDRKTSSKSRDIDQSEHHLGLAKETPLRRSTRRVNGLLFSSPIESEPRFSSTAATIIKLNLSGSLRTLDVRKQWDEKAQCLMKFIADSDGPRIGFTHRNFEIKNAQVEFLRDCDLIVFDRGCSCIGFVLKEARFIDMDNKSKIGRAHTRLFMWMSSVDGKDGKIAKIKDIVVESDSCKTKLVGSKALVVEKLDQAAIQDYKTKNSVKTTNEAFEKLKKTNYWDKKDFQSLGHQKRLSQFTSSASHKIHVPKTPVIHDLDESAIPHISTTDFFNKSSTPDIKNKSTSVDIDSKKDPIEELRMSCRTRSQSPALRQTTLWDLDSEKDFETPEVFKPKLHYKFADGTSYTVTNQDFKCLYNHDWINDSILDFFTKYYAERSIEKGIVGRDDVCIMSSFFYTKLVSDPNDYYGNVKKWVNNSDLFKKKFVVVPINSTFHWFGCVITNLDVLYNHFKEIDRNSHGNSHALQAINDKSIGHTFSKDDDELTVSTPIVKILTFDSLRQTHGREIDPIKEFLISYAKDKYSMNIDKALIKMKTCVVPQQPNMSDCGVHVILNTKRFFEDPVATMEVWRSTKTRSKASTRVVNEYFDKASRDKARKDLRNVLWDLLQTQIQLMHERNEDIEEKDAGTNDEDEDDGDLEIIENYPQNEEQTSSTKSANEDSPKATGQQETKLDSLSKKTVISDTSTTAATKHSANDHGDKNDDLVVDRARSLCDSTQPASQINALKSSPLQDIVRHDYKQSTKGVSSPYFGESPLTKRAASFDYEAGETFFSPTLSSFVDSQRSDADMDRTTRSNSSENTGSPIMLTNGVSNCRRFPRSSGHSREGKSSPPSPFNETVIVSDLEQDEDVNLVGGTQSEEGKSDDDALTHISKMAEKQSIENTSSTSNSLNRPNARKGPKIPSKKDTRQINDGTSYIEHGEGKPASFLVMSQNDVQAIPSDEER